jgi:hypothetical protein
VRELVVSRVPEGEGAAPAFEDEETLVADEEALADEEEASTDDGETLVDDEGDGVEDATGFGVAGSFVAEVAEGSCTARE